MKKALILLLALLSALSPASAEYWEDVTDRPFVCCDDRGGCQVLQMVMTGSFDGFDISDSLSVRVFSAALTRLCAVSEEDVAHFIKEFGVDEAVARRNYNVALGHCLWADILTFPVLDDLRATDARRVLLLFLDPSSEPNGLEQMALIRASIDDALVNMLAEAASLPASFVEYLVYDSDWYLNVYSRKADSDAKEGSPVITQ